MKRIVAGATGPGLQGPTGSANGPKSCFTVAPQENETILANSAQPTEGTCDFAANTTSAWTTNAA